MTTAEIIRETQNLPRRKSCGFFTTLGAMNGGDAAQRPLRLLRRLENGHPEDVWRGIEETEDGRFVNIKPPDAKPPWLPLARSSSSVSLSLGKNMKALHCSDCYWPMGWHMLGCATRGASRGAESNNGESSLQRSHRKRIKQGASNGWVAKANMRILGKPFATTMDRSLGRARCRHPWGSAVPVLMNVLRHGDQRAMEHACNALQRIGLDASASIPLLLELLGSDVTTANYAARALPTVGIGSKIVLEGLKDAHERGLQSGGAIEATLQKLQRAAEESR